VIDVDVLKAYFAISVCYSNNREPLVYS